MRKFTILAALVALPACSSGLAEHLDALSAHVDALAVRLDRFAPASTAAPSSGAPQHRTCPAHDGKPEVDLGVEQPCPGKPDDGMCLKLPSGEWIPFSVAAARCQAGKL